MLIINNYFLKFTATDQAMPYFYVPVGLLLLANAVLFILTFIKLAKCQKDLDLRRLARNQESDRRDRRFLRRLTRTTYVCLIVFLLMGLNWMIELISWFVNRDSVDWSTIDFINALQGVLIFGLFVLRRPQRDFVWYRIQQLRGLDVVEPETESMELYLLPVWKCFWFSVGVSVNDLVIFLRTPQSFSEETHVTDKVTNQSILRIRMDLLRTRHRWLIT